MVNSGMIIGTATVAASAAAGTTQNANLQSTPVVAAAASLTVPQSQTWVLADVYIRAAADAGTSDPILNYYKDGSFNLGSTPPISSLLVTNNTRPRPFAGRTLAYEPVSQISVQLQTTIANDATADSINFLTTLAISQTIPGPR